jgi:hypothetical protein
VQNFNIYDLMIQIINWVISASIGQTSWPLAGLKAGLPDPIAQNRLFGPVSGP